MTKAVCVGYLDRALMAPTLLTWCKKCFSCAIA